MIYAQTQHSLAALLHDVCTRHPQFRLQRLVLNWYLFGIAAMQLI